MTTSTCRLAAALTLTAFFGACSNGAKTPGNAGGSSGNNGGSGGTGNNGTPPPKGSCDNSQLDVLFSPMYSAFDGVHPFKLPAVVDGMTGVTWSATDPSLVDIAPDPMNNGGVMLTMRKAGTTQIIATAGGMCGVASLTISQASPSDWENGNARYNNGIVLVNGQPVRGNAPDAGEAREVACTNCHGDTANMAMGAFKTVSHTPTQTGGFSDDELIQIFTMGMVPTGGYFDESIVSYRAWQSFHRWTMTPEQAKGMIVYLRSLTPQNQMGMRGDFGGRRGDGGRMRGDGGFMRGDGGFMRREGGGGGGEDAAESTD
jgi:hypothetical protein